MRHICGSTKTIGEGTAHTRRVRASRWLVGVIVLVTAVLMALPAAAVGSTGNGNGNPITAFVAPTLLDAAQAYPSATFDVTPKLEATMARVATAASTRVIGPS